MKRMKTKILLFIIGEFKLDVFDEEIKYKAVQKQTINKANYDKVEKISIESMKKAF